MVYTIIVETIFMLSVSVFVIVLLGTLLKDDELSFKALFTKHRFKSWFFTIVSPWVLLIFGKYCADYDSFIAITTAFEWIAVDAIIICGWIAKKCWKYLTGDKNSGKIPKIIIEIVGYTAACCCVFIAIITIKFTIFCLIIMSGGWTIG